jgi:hypothetical protein
MIGLQKTSRSLWIVGIVSLLWNAIGGADYTMTHLRLVTLTPEMTAYVDAFPAWATACWAFGVWGAVTGSILLLLRSRWAVTAFGLSLLGLIGTRIYQYGVSVPPGGMTGADLGLTAALFIVALALLWYARQMQAKGVLR